MNLTNVKAHLGWVHSMVILEGQLVSVSYYDTIKIWPGTLIHMEDDIKYLQNTVSDGGQKHTKCFVRKQDKW